MRHFYFQSVGAALIHALEKKLGANFTGKPKSRSTVYDIIAEPVKEGAKKSQ